MTRHRWLWLSIGVLAAGVFGVFGWWLTRGRPAAPINSYARCAEAGYPIRESYPPTCSDGHNTFVGPEATVAPESPAGDSLPLEILVDGDSHGGYPNRQEVIATSSDWQRYWREVHVREPVLPPLLPVNFATHQVVALSEGPRSTGGYHIKITGIMRSASGTTVYVTESKPGTGCMVTQSVTNRYYIVRTAPLTQPVNFRITTDRHDC